MKLISFTVNGIRTEIVAEQIHAVSEGVDTRQGKADIIMSQGNSEAPFANLKKYGKNTEKIRTDQTFEEAVMIIANCALEDIDIEERNWS